MSFRLFLYYCAVGGAFAACVGGFPGQWAAGDEAFRAAAVTGVWLGAALSLSLGLIDALSTLSARNVVAVALRAGASLVVGATGGLAGALLGQALYWLWAWPAFLVLGWTITGLLIGAAPGTFDLLALRLLRRDSAGAGCKVRNGLIGGAAGGLIGGFLFLSLKGALTSLFPDASERDLWTPALAGFAALGCCVGLSVGLAQVLFKKTWLKIESGFRAGRQMIVSKSEITIGRGEACDVGLFGDASVDRLHARIVCQGNAYVLADAGSATGVFLNDTRISQPSPLRSGDSIRVGGCVLSFRQSTMNSRPG